MVKGRRMMVMHNGNYKMIIHRACKKIIQNVIYLGTQVYTQVFKQIALFSILNLIPDHHKQRHNKGCFPQVLYKGTTLF